LEKHVEVMTKERIIEMIKQKTNSLNTLEQVLMYYIKIMISNHFVEKYYNNIEMWNIVLADAYIKKFVQRYFNYLILKLRGNK
jgi:hypothetical protein